MPDSKINFFVGLFMLLGFVSLTFLIIGTSKIKNQLFYPSYKIYARFDNIGNLKINSPVKSSGVIVGKVLEISFDEVAFQAKVLIKINSRYSFPKDTSASIVTSGILGEQYLSLSPGNETEILSNEDVLLYTQSSLMIEQLINRFLFSGFPESFLFRIAQK